MASCGILTPHAAAENGYEQGGASGSMGLGKSGGAAGAAGSMSASETWVEVGSSRRYTPSTEDVGFTLKYEANLVDTTHRFNADTRPQVGLWQG